MKTHDAILLAQAQQPPTSWEAVYDDLLPGVYNFFRYRVGDDALAEDLTATTFLKAWRERERYQYDLSAFSTWLYTIARRVAIDHYRTHKSQLSLDALPDPADDVSVEQLVESRDDTERLQHLLATLTDRERELVALKYGGDLTNRAIAQMSGLSESNIGTLLHRIVQKLRDRWEKNL